MKLDDEIEAAHSIHAAKAKLDALTDEQKKIEDYCDHKKAERLDLLSQAWKDLIEIKMSVRREQLDKKRQELTQQMKKRGRSRVHRLLSWSNC